MEYVGPHRISPMPSPMVGELEIAGDGVVQGKTLSTPRRQSHRGF